VVVDEEASPVAVPSVMPIVVVEKLVCAVIVGVVVLLERGVPVTAVNVVASPVIVPPVI
jgi:hypothetical protein